MKQNLSFTINEAPADVTVEADETLLRVLRSNLGLTGTKEGCDDSECGACMVLVDGAPVNSCSYLALQVGGRTVTTVEGLRRGDRLDPLQAAFVEAGGVQCGFCTPGMLMSAKALLARNADPTNEEIASALAGNLCRCTGYTKIFDSVRAAARIQRARGASPE